jgi:hypothetical protein
MIRERCSCGAEFETDQSNALNLIRAWRKEHTCPPQQMDRPNLSSTTELTPTDNRNPELHLGFRPDPDLD